MKRVLSLCTATHEYAAFARRGEMLSHSRALSRKRLGLVSLSRYAENTRRSLATFSKVDGLSLESRAYSSRASSAFTRHSLRIINGSRPHNNCLTNISIRISNMPSTIQKRQHAGHAHHHHHHDNTYLVSSNKNDAGVKITRVGLFVNLAMAIGKGIGGWVFNSQALIADAFHALTDLVSDFMTLATISWSIKPPTERFPYGYGKVESLGALGVSGILLIGGIGMAMNGIDLLYLQFFHDHAHAAHGEHVHGLFGIGHSHSHSTDLPHINAAWLAAASVLVKEWLYRASKFSRLILRRSLTSRSYEDRPRTKILRTSLKCCSSPNRLTDEYCRPSDNSRSTCDL